ncbi:BMP family ABC transporter substrate-binding protein [Corticibacter populi]|uniref:BMP family ABC transporter substrate-binding protein n=1 Tax=Corticibacter populi TaxID=1550736 RepID=A0A3M6QR91_9BURK|nr:BMP family ABC transporter substrate-binding protein [Corticibacter populi]RMX04922.1 BMP family ABC transporter substrate-binding protein [Corticibacter populi]RZS33653.1 basic membrane lipoprotein Med (substrate-binding protein (PBP1-ABC) superfamily) [Corticibacter populi]
MSHRFLPALACAACLTVSVAMPALAQDGLTLKEPMKIAMLYISPRNDGGWTQAFDEARQKIENELDVKIQYVESVPENASAIRPTVERLIQRGANVVIGTAFGYSDTFKELATKYPQVAFLNASGTTSAPNLLSFNGRTYESQYLCGMAAAASSKSGKLGYVAANPVGPVNWAINGFALGAQSINPAATVTVIYTGAWNDPVKERAAATALLDAGADVLGQHVDSPTPQIVAQERGAHGTGHHRDMREFAPEATVCSSVWVWDRFLIPELKKVAAGDWKPNPNGALLSMQEGGTDAACCGPAVPAEQAERIMAAREEFLKGEKTLYSGPMSDRDGNERIAAGAVMPDAQLWQMDWFVKGVITQD